MLVSAFLGQVDWIKKAYQLAIEQQYRFYSYGDAMILGLEYEGEHRSGLFKLGLFK